MVCNTQNYWGFGLCPSSSILVTLENTTFRKLDLLPSSGEGVGDTYSVGLLERTDPNYWTGNRLVIEVSPNGPNRVGVSHPLN
jgi:hypothetical protein